jgi:single-strand DNA-binding protein
MSVNKAIIQGRLGRDPEIRDTANGKVANLSVATSKSWKDKSGERKEKTEWHRVTIWNQNTITNIVEKHLNKGDQVYIEGELETRKYEKDGVEHYTTSIVVANFGGDVQKIWTGGGDSDSERGDSRGSSGRSRDRDDDDRGNSRSSSRSRDDDADDRRSSSKAAPKRVSADADMEDDIPF